MSDFKVGDKFARESIKDNVSYAIGTIVKIFDYFGDIMADVVWDDPKYYHSTQGHLVANLILLKE